MFRNIFLLFLFQNKIYQINSAKDKSFTIGHRFRSVECIATEKTIAYFDICNLKAYSRTVAALNIGIAFNKKIYKPIHVFVTSNYRYGNIYREIYRVGPIEWCSIAEAVVTNPLIKHFFDSTKNIQTLVKKCPLEGRIEVKNVTSEGGQLLVFPTGLYRDEIKISNSNQSLLVKVDYEIKSDIKTSFG